MKIKEYILNKQNFKQFITFIFVGLTNTIICYVIYYILLKLGMFYPIAYFIGAVSGTVNSYIMNKVFTFKSNKRSLRQISKFITVYLVQYLLNISIISLLIEFLNLTAEVSGLFSTFICTIVSYVGHKFWSFKD